MATHIINFPGADIHTSKIKSSSGEFTSDGNLSLLTSGGGTTNLTATSGGNIGINKTVPAFTLDVNGDINFSGDLYQGGSEFVSTPWTIESGPTALSYTDGNVGIGLENPAYALDVGGTSNVGDLTANTVTVPNSGNFIMNSKKIIEASGLNWDSANSRLGIGTGIPQEKLDVRGTIVAPVVSYGSNRDDPYLIAASTSYTGASTNWGTYGIQHRIKSNSGGTPRVTIDTPIAGEAFCVTNNGSVGIGEDAPVAKLHVHGGIVTNADKIARKTYSHSGSIANGTAPANAKLRVTFGYSTFYAKIVAFLYEGDYDFSTIVAECSGGTWSGGLSTQNVTVGTNNIFGPTAANPWSSTITTGRDWIEFIPSQTMASAGNYHISIEYIGNNKVTNLAFGGSTAYTPPY